MMADMTSRNRLNSHTTDMQSRSIPKLSYCHHINSQRSVTMTDITS